MQQLGPIVGALASHQTHRRVPRSRLSIEQPAPIWRRRKQRPDWAAQGSGEITSNINGVAQAAESTSRGASDTQKAAQQLVETSAQLRKLIENLLIETLLIETTIADMPSHAWGSANLLLEYADNPITIYLHGDCVVLPSFSLGRPSSSGALGWVRLNHGHIEHFVHVECTRLAQTLASQTYGLDRDQRDRLMARAIARVILHEWIHIATQNPGHAGDGLAKATFSPRDLIANTINPPAGHNHIQ